MTRRPQRALDLGSYEYLVEFFEQDVLASYKEQANRFKIETDYFHGQLSSRYAEGTTPGNPIDIRFGYRALASGDLSIAIFKPDLYQKSPGHVERWSAFRPKSPKWADPDERYTRWIRCYFAGDWYVESGPRAKIEALLTKINALTTEVVGAPLFASDSLQDLVFPLAENTHRYEDAHQRLYGHLVDGIEKTCIRSLGARAGVALKLDSDRTVNALKKFPSRPPDTSPLWAALDQIQKQRRHASHRVRPPAKRFPAFEEFSKDLDLLVVGLNDLLACLEKALGMSGSLAEKRQSAKRFLLRSGRRLRQTTPSISSTRSSARPSRESSSASGASTHSSTEARP